MTMGGLWARLIMVSVVLAIYAASHMLAILLAVGAAVVTIGMIGYKGLYRGRYLPEPVLNWIEWLTNRLQKKKVEAGKEAELVTINAEDLAARLKAKVIGQDHVIDQVAQILRRRVAARRPDKPLAVFCFAGPPGVGKTHLAKVLAQTLFGGTNSLHFIDMSQNAASSLFGSPRGYTGSENYGQVTTALRDAPRSVMLLDEFEKADSEVHKRFLTAWNDGFATETSDGTKLPTNETIFILTTNAAARRIWELANEHKGGPEDLDRMVKSTLADAQFAPEVLSRIDEVFAFRDMRGLDIARVVALEIENIAHQFNLEIAAGGIDPQILLKAIDRVTEMGAKGGVRDISRSLEKQISDELVDARLGGATHVRLVADGDKIRVIPVKDEDTEPDAGRPVASALAG